MAVVLGIILNAVVVIVTVVVTVIMIVVFPLVETEEDAATVAELMINSEVNAMAAVIFIWKPLTVVYASFRKLTVTF